MEERLNRLERENRRLKTVGVLALAVMAAVVLMGQATGSKVPKVIEAEKFVVKDANGAVRAILGEGETVIPSPDEDSPRPLFGLHIYSVDGKDRAHLAEMGKKGTRLQLYDSELKGVASVSAGSRAAFFFLGGYEEGLEELGQRRKELMDEFKRQMEKCERQEVDAESLKAQFSEFFRLPPGAISMYGSSKSGRIKIGQVSHDDPRMRGIVDLASVGGRPSIMLTAKDSTFASLLGFPLGFRDAGLVLGGKGKQRADLVIRDDGSVALRLLDQDGKVIWTAP